MHNRGPRIPREAKDRVIVARRQAEEKMKQARKEIYLRDKHVAASQAERLANEKAFREDYESERKLERQALELEQFARQGRAVLKNPAHEEDESAWLAHKIALIELDKKQKPVESKPAPSAASVPPPSYEQSKKHPTVQCITMGEKFNLKIFDSKEQKDKPPQYTSIKPRV